MKTLQITFGTLVVALALVFASTSSIYAQQQIIGTSLIKVNINGVESEVSPDINTTKGDYSQGDFVRTAPVQEHEDVDLGGGWFFLVNVTNSRGILQTTGGPDFFPANGGARLFGVVSNGVSDLEATAPIIIRSRDPLPEYPCPIEVPFDVQQDVTFSDGQNTVTIRAGSTLFLRGA